MSGRSHFKQIQGASTRHGERDYMLLQDMIFEKTGVHSTIVVRSGYVSIRTRDIADYYLARSVIKNLVGSKTIVRDLQDLG